MISGTVIGDKSNVARKLTNFDIEKKVETGNVSDYNPNLQVTKAKPVYGLQRMNGEHFPTPKSAFDWPLTRQISWFTLHHKHVKKKTLTSKNSQD